MSTKTEQGPFDALTKAADNEPIFTLLARDPCSPATITEWCRLRRNLAYKLYGHSTNDTDQKLMQAELIQCAEAETIAEQMDSWRKDEVEVEGEKVLYQDVQKSDVEIAAAADLTRRQKITKHLREAAYHLSEARELSLPDEGTKATMGILLDNINAFAERFAAKRVT